MIVSRGGIVKRPKYTSGLLAVTFLSLGIVFLILGILCFAGVIKPSAHSSVQDPIHLGIVFSSFGLAFCIVQAIIRLINYKLDALNNELFTSGTKIQGTVEKVNLQTYIRFGNKSPFRICYTYSYQGAVYHHKSGLLWEKPSLHEGDPIQVYANDFGKSTIQL